MLHTAALKDVFIIYLLFMGGLSTCMSVYNMDAQCLWRLEEKTLLDILVLGVIDGRELSCQYWEHNLGPLEEHQALLTVESSL